MRIKPLARSIALGICGAVAVLPLRADEGTTAEEDKHGLLQGVFDDTRFGTWLDEQHIAISGHVEAGITGNFDDPNDRQNFGRLFDDRANEPLLNQAVLTFERALAPEEGKWDWGFKFQGMVGSDTRFIHTLGWLDNLNNDIIGIDIVEFYATVHLPYLTKGGIDIKAGQFVTLMGAEVIYAPANPLYSHSYIFNFGIPLKHSGLMVTSHLTDQIDICAGMVTGINTGTDDNNDALSFHGGVSWKSPNEKVLLFGSFHYGPENDTKYGKAGFGGVDPNDDGRIIGDVVATIKPTDNLTLITDLNYGWDDGFAAEWYGIAQYVTLQINDWLGVVVRGEAFRDDDGFAVAKFKDNDDFIDVLSGEPAGGAVFGADTTYAALTLGLNIAPHSTLTLRPEVRWDWSSGGNKPFNDGGDNQMFTVAMDVIFKF